MLKPGATANEITGVALEEMARSWLTTEAVINRFAHVISPEILFSVVENNLKLDLSDEAAARQSAAVLGQYARNGVTIRAEFDTAQENWTLRVERFHHGNLKVGVISDSLLASGDFRQIQSTAALLSGLFGAGATIQRGEKKHLVSNFAQAMQWLLNEVERGISKQRYKGLGEMNPEQLWETTMDPQVRRLLKVGIEDAIGADQIFTTLMGELVEPRRNFIESNAVYARNIDV